MHITNISIHLSVCLALSICLSLSVCISRNIIDIIIVLMFTGIMLISLLTVFARQPDYVWIPVMIDDIGVSERSRVSDEIIIFASSPQAQD